MGKWQDFRDRKTKVINDYLAVRKIKHKKYEMAKFYARESIKLQIVKMLFDKYLK
jgi:hypothetical protein